MECKDLKAVCLVLIICVASTLARFLNDTQNENSSIQDYGTQNPGQQLSKNPDCDCEWRYLKHYEAKGCRPVYEEKPNDGKSECTCPWRFDCSQADEVNADEKVCVYKKHVYPVGSKIPTTNPCDTCSCTTDYFTQAATITCTTTDCPSAYSQTPLPEGCHYVYNENQCCPTTIECPANQKENSFKVPICEYKGKMYYEGEKIYPNEDPCLTCICNQNWTGINSTTCRQHDCMLERESRKLKQGCIPIYHEKTCCPIDYHCADDDFDFKANRGANFKSEDDEDEMCHFEGRYYPVGHVLDIKHPTHCVTCTCKTPPDFTCIHSSCPPPPNGDYANCRAVYKPNACCPDYKCHEKKEETESPKKETETTEEPQRDSLQILIQGCKKMPCASDERCMLVEKKCENETCLPVQQCEKVSFGCGQKSCAEGCEEIGSYENNCPICYCKSEVKEPQYKLTCHVQSCEENCILTGRDQDGCPLCKCPQGNLEERACAQSYCKGYNCTMTVNSLGCAECRCQLSCKPRECPVGCDMDLDVPQDSGLECGCTCKNSTTAMEYIQSKTVPENCKPVSCEGLNCTVTEDQFGCPVCACKSPCPVPECQEGCQVEKEVKEPGRCPGCVCKLSRSARDNTAKECPPPTCLGYNCSVIAGADGCQKCLCESPCEETPQCPSHCELETNVPEGRCRGCICSFGENSESDHKAQRGGGRVPDDSEDEIEPEKREDVEADFIPMPGKDIVPGVDKIYLVHGDKDEGHYSNLPGYHYEGGHAFSVVGEHLESGLYNTDERVPGEAENAHHDEADEDLYEEASEDRHDLVEYDDDDKYDHHFAEEKAADDDEEDKCSQKNCPEGQKCVIRRLQCIRTPCPTIPVCIDVEPRCPIPMCSIGCMVMKWDDEVCPSCFCGIIRGAEGRVCPRTRCIGRRCYNVIGDDGCPTCKCDSICIPPTCSNGCWIETDPPEGKCPTCTCPQRGTVVPPIRSGTSPSITTLGPNVEPGNDSEIVEDPSDPSEDYENKEEVPTNYFEEDELEIRDPSTDITTEVTEEIPVSEEQGTTTEATTVPKEEPSTESHTIDFYDSLAEIEEQIKLKDYTPIAENIPVEPEESGLYETSTGIITDDFEGKYTFDHHSPSVTGTQMSDTVLSSTGKPPHKSSPYKLKTTLEPTTHSTTEVVDLTTEQHQTTVKPCMSDPAIKPEEVTLEVSSTPQPTISITSKATPTNEEISQRVRRPTSVPTTRKPPRKQPLRRRPPTHSPPLKFTNTHRRPVENYKVKPKPQIHTAMQNQEKLNGETERVSSSRPNHQTHSHRRKPVPKPQVIHHVSSVEENKNNTNDDSNMKPILQNLQQLMSNLQNVLSNHQRPTQLRDPVKVISEVQSGEAEVSKPVNESVLHMTNSSHSSQKIQVPETATQVHEENKDSTPKPITPLITPSESENNSNKNSGVESLEEHNNVSATNPSDVQKEPISQFSGFQANPYQQYYLNNPNIQSLLASHHQLLTNPQFAQLFQQGMNPQYALFPQYPYQSTAGGIQAYGFQYQPQIPNVPYQSHIPHPSPSIMHSQSPVVNPLAVQTSGQTAQQQSSFYPTLQQSYASNIPSSTEHYSHPSAQLQNPHVLLTNIPIPPSLQQQLKSGTQTLGFLQYYLKPSEQTIFQHNLQQHSPSSIESSQISQPEMHTLQFLQKNTQNNIPSPSTSAPTTDEQSEEVNSPVESVDQELQQKEPIEQIISDSKSQNGENEAPSQSQVTSSILDQSSLNDTEEHTMPPFPETSSTTVSTIFNESDISTSSVFYEGGSSEQDLNVQPLDILPLVVQEFNHHAPPAQQPSHSPPAQQPSHAPPKVIPSPNMSQQMQQQQTLQSQQQQPPSETAEKQQLQIQSQESQSNSELQPEIQERPYQITDNNQNPKETNQGLNLPPVFPQDANSQSSLSSQTYNNYNQQSQQNMNPNVHVTAHYRPINITQQGSYWQHNQNGLPNSNQRPTEHGQIQLTGSQNQIQLPNVPFQSADESLKLNLQNTAHTPTTNQQSFLSSNENFNVPFGYQQQFQNSHGQIPYQSHVTPHENHQQQMSQNVEHHHQQGQQIQTQIANLQGSAQYQQNYYQQYQNVQDKIPTAQDTLQSQSTAQINQHYQPNPSFINTEKNPPYQEQYQNQFQNDKPSSQQQNNQQHYISNHNILQPVNMPQHISSQNEVPTQYQQQIQANPVSSNYASTNYQDQNKHFGNQQTQESSSTHIQGINQRPQQQNVHQHFYQQGDTQSSQQGYQSNHQQYTMHFSKPLQGQLNNQHSQQSYLGQNSQQNQPSHMFIQNPNIVQTQPLQQGFLVGLNSHGPEKQQGSDSATTFSHSFLNLSPQVQQQNNILNQFSSSQQEQYLVNSQEKASQAQYQTDSLQKQQTISLPNPAVSQHQQINQHFATRPIVNAQPHIPQQFDVPNPIHIQQQYASTPEKQSVPQIQEQSPVVNIPGELMSSQIGSFQQIYQQSHLSNINEPQTPYIQSLNTDGRPQVQQAQQFFSENPVIHSQVQHPTNDQTQLPQQAQNQQQYIGLSQSISGHLSNDDKPQQQQQIQQQLTLPNKPIISVDRISDKNIQAYIAQQTKPVVQQNFMIQQDQSVQHQLTSNISPSISAQATENFNLNNQQSTQILQQNQQQYIDQSQQNQHFINANDKPEIVKDTVQDRPSSSQAMLQQHVNQFHQTSEFPDQQHVDNSNQAHIQQAYITNQSTVLHLADTQEQYTQSEQDQKHQHSGQHFVHAQDESDLMQQYHQEFHDDNHDDLQAEQQKFEEQIHNDEDQNLSQAQEIHQQHDEDKYSALKPIAQITTADSQVNVHHEDIHDEDQSDVFESHDEKPDEEHDEDIESVVQQSVAPFDPETPKPHNVKTRPGVTSHPHFHPVGYKPSPEPQADSHDLFPAPSRPLKRKPEVQEDWVDQEFVEEDMPQEVGEFDEEDYDFYETPSTTTPKPTNLPKRKPSRRPPVRFSPTTQSTTTTSQSYQEEFMQTFDIHQPDNKKPVDHQEFIDEFETTTPKKFIFVRTSTTSRPSTKNPIPFASFPTVSPTAEAYGMKQHVTKPPVNPFASYHCPTPHCNGYNCSLIRGSDGCQKCVCDSPCAPCPQHCVKTKTLSEGRCPICDCTNTAAVQSDTSRQCPVMECGGSNCRKVRDNNGCYTCICDPKCAEPKCDPGCEILTNVPPGQCPGCVCRVTVVQAVVNRPKNCPSVQCTGPNCRTTRGPDGCLQCVCDGCPPPKCDPGCELQTDVAQGQCPTCVCPTYNDDDEQAEDESYCPNLFCSDYGCREVPGPAGCPICMCDPECAAPVCEPGCQVVTNKFTGKCPVCMCSSPVHSEMSSPNTSQQQHSDGIKSAQQQVQQEEQHQVTFSGLVQPVVAEEEETIFTTVSVDVETTEEPTTESPTCPAPVCSGLRCSYETGEDGCEVCKCRYKCPTPKCVGNCYAETNAPAHRCPGCVCPSRRKPALNH